MDCNDIEIWRPISRFEGLYDVSSHGNVKSIQRVVSHSICGTKTINARILKKILPCKYYTVKLSKDGVIEVASIHVLVATAFHKNHENKKCVNHKDGNKLNNHHSNLEWATYAENNKHAFQIGVRSHKGDKCPSSKLKTSQVIEIKQILQSGTKTTLKAIGEMFGVSWSTIRDIKKGFTWTHLSS